MNRARYHSPKPSPRKQFLSVTILSFCPFLYLFHPIVVAFSLSSALFFYMIFFLLSTLLKVSVIFCAVPFSSLAFPHHAFSAFQLLPFCRLPALACFAFLRAILLRHSLPRPARAFEPRLCVPSVVPSPSSPLATDRLTEHNKKIHPVLVSVNLSCSAGLFRRYGRQTGRWPRDNDTQSSSSTHSQWQSLHV